MLRNMCPGLKALIPYCLIFEGGMYENGKLTRKEFEVVFRSENTRCLHISIVPDGKQPDRLKFFLFTFFDVYFVLNFH